MRVKLEVLIVEEAKKYKFKEEGQQLWWKKDAAKEPLVKEKVAQPKALLLNIEREKGANQKSTMQPSHHIHYLRICWLFPQTCCICCQRF